MNKKAIYKTVLIISAAVFVLSAVCLGFNLYNQFRAEQEYKTTEAVSVITTQENETAVFNPVPFKDLKQKNDEIYAWIKIDNTKVDYPIVQHGADDTFYLNHSAVDKSYLQSGAIYTEKCSAKDFSDAVTLVYGHNNYGDTMFTTLHHFEDKVFFDSNEYFYVYLPQRKITYQVISAFKYDDRHILNTNDFSDKAQLSEFQNMIMNPDSSLKNVRQQFDKPVDENSRILVLSTCVTGDNSSRYLICALLVHDEKTD